MGAINGRFQHSPEEAQLALIERFGVGVIRAAIRWQRSERSADLYATWWSGFADGATCAWCRRAYDRARTQEGEDAARHSGGQERWFCGRSCEAAAKRWAKRVADHAVIRGSEPRWSTCEVCGCDFWDVAPSENLRPGHARTVCPPQWVAGNSWYIDKSSCERVAEREGRVTKAGRKPRAEVAAKSRQRKARYRAKILRVVEGSCAAFELSRAGLDVAAIAARMGCRADTAAALVAHASDAIEHLARCDGSPCTEAAPQVAHRYAGRFRMAERGVFTAWQRVHEAETAERAARQAAARERLARIEADLADATDKDDDLAA